MNDSPPEITPGRALSGLKFFLLVLLVGAGWFVLRGTPVGDAVRDYEWVRLRMVESGAWGGWLFAAGGAVRTMAGPPRMALAFGGGVVFGAVGGTVWSLLGALLGAGALFHLARFLGRDFVLPRLPVRIRRYDTLLRENTFLVILSIRFFPLGHNTLTNLLAGVSTARALPFFTATLAGYLPTTVVFALMGAGLQKASLVQTAAGAGLFLVSVGIMALAARRIRARAGGEGDD